MDTVQLNLQVVKRTLSELQAKIAKLIYTARRWHPELLPKLEGVQKRLTKVEKAIDKEFSYKASCDRLAEFRVLIDSYESDLTMGRKYGFIKR